MQNQTYLTLNNGIKIPQLGIGVFLTPEEECEKACLEALKLGVRHIDTAHMYNNEKQVGEAMKKSGIPRKEIFLTSKLWISEYEDAYNGIEKMLKRLNTDYIDLVLLHQPGGNYIKAYKDMEKAYEKGLVKSIGLSNFEGNDLDEVLKIAKIKPAVNQVECHPYFQQVNLKKRLEPYKTIIEAWYPIGHGDKALLNDEIFVKLGKKYKKTPVQIILRWHIQSGNVIFPKSTNPVHIKENYEIFDFNLTQEEMDQINKFGDKKRYYVRTDEMLKTFATFKPKYD